METQSTKNKRENIDCLLTQPINTQLEIISHHMEICRIVINTLLDQEVSTYTGEKYSRDKPKEGKYYRWGYNPGSVKLGGQKIKVQVPRVYDKQEKQNIPLEFYEQLKHLPEQDRMMVQSILHGMSTRDYKQVVDKLSDSFGISESSVSRSFKERSRQALEEFENRKLDEQRYVAMLIDGKYLAGEQMVIALGITEQGYKVPLGVVQTTTENSRSIKGLLKDLIQRGLKFEDGLLFIIDGSKGLRKAIEDVFGDNAIVQRCQWHKRENVVSHLTGSQQESFRNRLRVAYRLPTYEDAKAELMDIKNELEPINRSAAKSLEEGMDETLTIHKLDLYMVLSRSFTTTNCLESVNSMLSKYVSRVKHWMNSEQRYRWVVCGLMEIEYRMKKVDNYTKIPLLKKRIKNEIEKREQNKKQRAACANSGVIDHPISV